METIFKIFKVINKTLLAIVLGFTFSMAIIHVPSTFGIADDFFGNIWIRGIIVYVCQCLGFVYMFKCVDW